MIADATKPDQRIGNMDIQWLLQLPQQMTESGKIVSAPLALRAGDLLRASVLDVEKGRDALLAFGRFRAYARLPMPIVSGQAVQIRVEEKGDRLRMVMVPKRVPLATGPDSDRLEIRLFEPVSDKPFLSTHSRSLVPGTTLKGRITGFEKDGLLLVDFGKFKAFAKIDIPVRQGQIIPLNVVKNENGITFAVSSKGRSYGAAPAPPSMASMGAPSPDRAGAVQTVAAARSPGQAQAAMPSPPVAGAAATVADVSLPLTVADMAGLREQVQQLIDRMVQPGKDASMPFANPMKAALINLQQMLNPATTVGDKGTLVARVRDFVENSGLYFEKRLEAAINSLQDRPTSRTATELAAHPAIRDIMVKDLKPNLLILKQFLDTQPFETQAADRHMLETLKSVVQRAVANIEQQQFTATEKPVDPDLFQAFSHLMFLTGTGRNARLKVYYAKKGRAGDQKHPRVSLLLEMDRMGTVRSDLWMVGKDLNITFFVQDADAKAAIETEHHLIGEMLSDIFNTVAVSVLVNEKKIAEFDGEDLTLSEGRQVDLSI
jgi:hypothetical protein